MKNALERAYVICALVYFTGAFFSMSEASRGIAASPTEGDVTMFALQSIVYLLAFFFAFIQWQRFLLAAFESKWLFLLVALAITSTLWSQVSYLSFRRGLVVLATTIFGVYFGTRFSREEQLKLLSYALGFVCIASVVTAVMLPAYGIDHLYHFGDWRGVFSEKNVLGRLMVLSAIVWLMAPHRASFSWGGTLLSAAVVYLSGSRAALIIGVLLLISLPLFRSLRGRPATLALLLTLLILVGTAACALLMEDTDALLLMLGRDATLTGRTRIWGAALLSIRNRPWLGYGFNAFWLGLQGASLSVITDIRWVSPHAHNGLLDLWLELGIAGVALFVVGLASRFRTAVSEYRFTGTPAALWPLVYLSFMVLYNIGESNILKPNSIFWVLYTAATVRTLVVQHVHENRTCLFQQVPDSKLCTA